MPSSRRSKSERIPTWVPLLIIAIFFALIWVGTRYGVRLWAVVKIWSQVESVNEDGVLIQEDTFSCVPCSMSMLMEDEGVEASPAELAWIAGTDLNGTTPEGTLRAAEKYGFTVTETEMGFDELMEANFPALVEFTYRGNLHVVYARPDPDNHRLVIRNPSEGLAYVYRNGVSEYFSTDRWTVYLFVKNE